MFKEPFVSRKYFTTVGNFGHGKNFRARSYFGSSSMVFGGRPFSLLLSLLRFPKLVALLLLPHYPIAVPNCDRSHCQTYSVEKHERLKIEKKGSSCLAAVALAVADGKYQLSLHAAPKIEAFHVHCTPLCKDDLNAQNTSRYSLSRRTLMRKSPRLEAMLSDANLHC